MTVRRSSRRGFLALCGAAATVRGDDGTVRVKPTTALRYLRDRVEPSYPTMAWNLGVEGRVLVDATIDRSGEVVDVRTAEGHPVLGYAAGRALRRWRFRPILVRETPARVVCEFEFEFRRR